MKIRKERNSLNWLFSLLILALALVALLTALGNLHGVSEIEGKRQLEQSLYRATVSCYTIEGQYPTDLDYLKQHYGIQIDESRYTVFYEIFADNIMPDITVLSKSAT